MIKALITGVTGMVGSHLADYLLTNTSWKIFGACRWRSPIENIQHLNKRINLRDRVDLEYLDLADYTSIYDALKKIKPD